nr:mel-13b protein - mouse [Mus musculus]
MAFFFFSVSKSYLPACLVEAVSEAGNLFLAGPMVPQRPSQASGGTEDTHQIGAGCRENLQVVCMWPKQESALL